MKENKTDAKKYRHELKYIINSGYYHILQSRLKAVLKTDKNGKNGVYRITSLYFDDIYQTAYNDKLLGLNSRKKYRIRFYNFSPDVIKLEVKEKKGDLVCKRSVPLTCEQYMLILEGKREFLSDSSFTNTAAEEFYLSDKLVKLIPAVMVDYEREAYICDYGNVRITFDRKLKTRQKPDFPHNNSEFINVLNNREIILEIKYDSFIPSYIQELFSGIPLMRESVSKFVLCKDKLTEVSKCSYYQKIS